MHVCFCEFSMKSLFFNLGTSAGKPDTPYNCTISNQTSTSLDVECLDAFDGGQPQKFQLEVYDQETHLLLVNRTSRHISFHLGDLAAGSSLKMKVYAFNSKGKSEPVFFEGYTLKVAAKQTGIYVMNFFRIDTYSLNLNTTYMVNWEIDYSE